MEGRHEGLEPLDRAYDLSSLSGEVEAVGRGDRSMQQCPHGSRWPSANAAEQSSFAPVAVRSRASPLGRVPPAPGV